MDCEGLTIMRNRSAEVETSFRKRTRKAAPNVSIYIQAVSMYDPALTGQVLKQPGAHGICNISALTGMTAIKRHISISPPVHGGFVIDRVKQ
jgi:hypothetical protein